MARVNYKKIETEGKIVVSIIVPVYKSERTLTRCVESLLMQEYRDIEILLIVDGPPDGSGILAEQLAQRDDRIRVINQSNCGVSRARNRGLKEAKGKYIRFVDSDDYVEPDGLSQMVERIERDRSDLVIAGFHHLYFGQTITKIPHMDGLLATKEDFANMRRLYEDGFLNMPWNKLFVRARIMRGGASGLAKEEKRTKETNSTEGQEEYGFPVAISLGEDLVFNQSYIAKTAKISVMQTCVCEYVQDDRGTTLSTKKRDDKIDMALLLHQKSADFFRSLYNDVDLAFLDKKVVTTFLDEMECLGFADANTAEKKEALIKYMAACRRFVQKNNCTRMRLGLLDYRIIFFCVRKNQVALTYLMIVLRTLVVKTVRVMRRGRNK